jgi:DNA-binding response OmpR family regulator
MAHILIVEDESALERILTLNLIKRGHSVAEARTAQEADDLAHATSPPFDLVILDINLPDQTGWNLLRRWRTRADVFIPPILVTTAIRPSEERIREFCPLAVLVKPFPLETFLFQVNRALGLDRENQFSPFDAEFES